MFTCWASFRNVQVRTRAFDSARYTNVLTLKSQEIFESWPIVIFVIRKFEHSRDVIWTCQNAIILFYHFFFLILTVGVQSLIFPSAIWNNFCPCSIATKKLGRTVVVTDTKRCAAADDIFSGTWEYDCDGKSVLLYDIYFG